MDQPDPPASPFGGETILAPLTKGGNLPFRRLCVELGARVTMSEMAYARQIVRRSRSEFALLRKHDSETCFGAQLAAGRAADAVAAGRAAVERGAAFVDINAGCPIHDVVRRGMGVTLMRRPDALVAIVERLAAELPVPVTVKLRTGWSASEPNALELAQRVEAAGAAAVTLHARSREQRYSRAADWTWVARLVEACTVPVVGNGDILTWYEARDRRDASGCAAVMVGRGALIKPWVFDEIRTQRTWQPTAEERVAVYRRLVAFMKEHFRDDAKGRERAMRFLPWHFSFFCRYRTLPDADWEARSREHPLIQTRLPRSEGSPLELLLQDARDEVHERIAAALWDAESDAAAVAALTRIATEIPPVDRRGRRDRRRPRLIRRRGLAFQDRMSRVPIRTRHSVLKLPWDARHNTSPTPSSPCSRSSGTEGAHAVREVADRLYAAAGNSECATVQKAV